MQSDRIQVRLSPALRGAVEHAARAQGIPVSTWIRNQLVIALYLDGMAEAPHVIYQGIRHALEPELLTIRGTQTALETLLSILPDALESVAPEAVVQTLRDLINRERANFHGGDA